jgi:hypothetical protein
MVLDVSLLQLSLLWGPTMFFSSEAFPGACQQAGVPAYLQTPSQLHMNPFSALSFIAKLRERVHNYFLNVFISL